MGFDSKAFCRCYTELVAKRTVNKNHSKLQTTHKWVTCISNLTARSHLVGILDETDEVCDDSSQPYPETAALNDERL